MTLLHSEFRSTTVNFWLHCEHLFEPIIKGHTRMKKEEKKWRKRKKKITQIFVWVIRVHYCRNYKHLSKNYHASFFSARLTHHLVCKIVIEKSQHKYAKIVRKSKWNQIYRFRRPCQFWSKFQNTSHSAGQACERKNRGPNSLQCWNAVYVWICSLATSIQQQQVFWAENWPSPIFSFSLHTINVSTEIVF